MTGTPEERAQKLHLAWPPAPKPMGLYKPTVRVGNLLYTSGHGPLKEDGTLILGVVGKDVTLEQAAIAARQTGLAMLASLRATLGSLNKVKRIVKTFGLVQCVAEFKDQPKVINGFSELMKEIFGDEHGVGARSAVGTLALPGNMCVEIEAIFEVEQATLQVSQ